MAGDKPQMTGRILIAGVGNIFLADDGFGTQVAKRLSSMDLPEAVRVADYGISGLHLAYDIAEGYDAVILIDAASSGSRPGTVTVTEVGPEHGRDSAAAEPAAAPVFDAHGMQPDVVFGVLDMLGARTGRIFVVGCEPGALDYRIGLSEPVEAAVDEAVRIVMGLIATAGPGPSVSARPSVSPPASRAAPPSNRATSSISAPPGISRPPTISPRPSVSAPPRLTPPPSISAPPGISAPPTIAPRHWLGCHRRGVGNHRPHGADRAPVFRRHLG
ncbi:MAG TPA: hydrogenase maturation protease [Streptosporangiaceae bacterium]